MKSRMFTLNLKSVVILMILLTFSQISFSQTIVSFDLTANNAATTYIPGNSGVTMTTVGLSNTNGFNSNGWTCYGWNSVGSDSWVTTSFSTQGYWKLSGSFQMKANTNIGPRDFKVQYNIPSIDGLWYDCTITTIDATSYNAVSYPLTNGFRTYNFSIPSNCNNKAAVNVRWVQDSAYQLNGVTPIGVGATNNASLKGVSIAGSAFASPEAQASNISIIAITATTIKITATNGNGTNRIIKINTSNSFTDPVNDYNPTANTTYSGSGEQVIYNGTGSSVTVTNINSTSVYWFRVYEYNKLDNLTRYNITTASANPKQCKLEKICCPISANIRLVNVTLGATINGPSTGTISDRGVYWSTTSPVDETGNMESLGGSATGDFTIPVLGVDRGTTIYFKGYVTNESGTNLSEEGSFSNVPVFTGTGNWETGSNWNVNQIPGTNGDVPYISGNEPGDSPIINGLCTLTATNTVDNLTVSSNRLTIKPAVTMNVTGTLTNNVGSSGILIKSSSTLPNGTLTFGSGNPQASVEMYSKANWDFSRTVANGFPQYSIYQWQFFGIPVQSLTASSTFDFTKCYVREWDESSVLTEDAWVKGGAGQSLYKNAGSTLDQNHGYELVQQSPTPYTFAGYLFNGTFDQSLSYSPGAYFAGQHIFGNPYTASITIDNISFGANTEKAIYQYNTGSYGQWSSNGGETTPSYSLALTPGQYSVSTPFTAGNLGLLREIPPMQGFLVKATANPGHITISKSALTPVSVSQRVKSQTQVSDKVATRIDVVSAHSADCMWIFTDPTCTRNFDNGWDGRKLLGASTIAQVYSIENDGIYQINAVNDMNDSYLGFQPGNETQFKLVFNHENINAKYSTVYLVDLVANKSVDITQSGTEYTFSASSNDATQRFKIITQPNIVNGLNLNNGSDQKLKVFNSETAAFIQNFTGNDGHFALIDLTGKIIQQASIKSNGITTVSLTKLLQGTYIIKAETDNEKVTQKLLIR